MEKTFIGQNIDIFIGIIATIISVYIPLGIVFLQDIGKDSKTFQEFDTKIIKEKLINLKYIIVSIILYFIVLLLGNNYYFESSNQQIILIINIIILIFIICDSLSQIYKWFSYIGKSQIRHEYLIQEKNSNIRYNLFKNTDNIEDGSLIINSYFKILNNEEDREIVSSLLELFPISENKDNIYQKLFVNRGGQTRIFSELLLLYNKSWIKENINNSNNIGRENSIIINIFKSYFSHITKTESYNLIYLINIHLKEISDKDYKDFLLENILIIILDSENLVGEKEFIKEISRRIKEYNFDISNISYNNKIQNIIIKRIEEQILENQYENTYIKKIDHVIMRFLPGIDLRYFSTLFYFYFILRYEEEDKINIYSKHNRNFGKSQSMLSGLVPGGSNRKNKIQEENNNRIKHTTVLFKQLFEGYNIDINQQNIINNLNKIKKINNDDIKQDEINKLNNLKICLEYLLKYGF